ncbi:hypothetical protein A0H81_14091 [Grifola frondosa]|uniref:F-box domain-containing protein n=1 Tax=Grifola frondosa TaxID=5627 RepID=A0A1C7LM64_GRIFR|nr:hypothetical protein A0H81_14091 [Grifola frondosa]
MERSFPPNKHMHEIADGAKVVPGEKAGARPLIYRRLPPELLLHVLRLAIPPSHELEVSLIGGSNSGWMQAMRTKKSFPLVCRGWFEVGMEILYEDIVLLRIGQIAALADTLETSCYCVSDLIKGLQLRCLSRHRHSLVKSIWKDVQYILDRCRRLKTFCSWPYDSDFDPDWQSYKVNTWFLLSEKNRAGLALERRAAELRTLELFVRVISFEYCIRDTLPQLLNACANLVSLHLHFSSNMSLKTPHVPARVYLPMLEDLEFCYNHAIITAWDLPKLKRLTWNAAFPLELQLLAKHGHRLMYLHLFCYNNIHDGDIAEILTLCPVLEHLIIPWCRIERDTAIFASVKLSYLDLWVVWRDDDPGHAMALHKSLLAPVRHFAQIENVRILDRYSLSSYTFSPRLPLICHPALVEEGETMHHILAGHNPVMQTSWGVLRECHPAYASDEDEDDEWADDVDSSSSESSLDLGDDITSSQLKRLGPRTSRHAW